MNRALTFTGAFVATALVAAGLAFGQQQAPKADCKAGAPQKVEGQVVRVDPATNKVTIRDKGGATHEFQATKDTTKDMKPGDQVEARLREAPKC
jgi:Cu/Ag efflux protein CusF